MDLFKIIQNLYDEKSRIDRAIAVIEELATSVPPVAESSEKERPVGKKRRGRPRKSRPLPS